MRLFDSDDERARKGPLQEDASLPTNGPTLSDSMSFLGVVLRYLCLGRSDSGVKAVLDFRLAAILKKLPRGREKEPNK